MILQFFRLQLEIISVFKKKILLNALNNYVCRFTLLLVLVCSGVEPFLYHWGKPYLWVPT
jgi:hypothetical protein